jgi:hypothetical protein
MRIASLRLGWTIPERAVAMGRGDRAADLWGYTQQDAAARAFLRALEAFFIVAPRVTADEDFDTLRRRAYPDVPAKPGEWTAFFDCAKAKRILGWEHTD